MPRFYVCSLSLSLRIIAHTIQAAAHRNNKLIHTLHNNQRAPESVIKNVLHVATASNGLILIETVDTRMIMPSNAAYRFRSN
jgi:hypothetical protein